MERVYICINENSKGVAHVEVIQQKKREAISRIYIEHYYQSWDTLLFFFHLHTMNQLLPKESSEQCTTATPVSLDGNQSNQVLFDMGSIDPFKESVELQACSDTLTVAQLSVEATEDDLETVSSASYRAIPTSLSLGRQSSTDYGDEDIEDIDMDYDRELPRETQVHLPAMEIVIRNLGILQERQKAQANAHLKPAKERCMNSTDTHDIDYSLEPPIDTQLYNSSLNNLDRSIKDIPVNRLGPREQEEAGTSLTF